MFQSGKQTADKPEHSVQRSCKAFTDMRHNILTAYQILHSVCYLTGAQTMRIFRHSYKRVLRMLIPAGRLIDRAVNFLILRHVKRLVNDIYTETKRFAAGFPIAVSRAKTEFSGGVLSGIKFLMSLPFIAAKRHRRAAITMLNLAAPAAAVFALVFTIQFWSGMTFALAVEYDGHKLGYISDEKVYDDAANMAAERVINTDNSFEVQRVPKLTIAVVSKSDILDQVAVCDKILESSGDSIAEGSGLYVDGKFEGAVQSREELESFLGSLLDNYRTDNKDERVEFVQNVEIVDGLYPISSIVPIDSMSTNLTRLSVVDRYYKIVKGDSPLLIAAKADMSLAQLRALNPNFDNNIFPDVNVLIQKSQPYLQIQVVRTIEYTESIGYSTKTVQDSSKYVGYSVTQKNGVDGKRHVKAEVMLIDGIEQSRKILETKVIQAPVDKVVVNGSKKVVPTAGNGIATGRFTWPLPSCHMISSQYGYRYGRFHSGVDISGNGVYGKPVIASDGGRVVESSYGWNSGYGNYIIVDHGGGYRTLYAHLSSILVKTGQTVSKGQQIGLAGSSGNSTGPHLHFEIQINGRTVNPLSYTQ